MVTETLTGGGETPEQLASYIFDTYVWPESLCASVGRRKCKEGFVTDIAERIRKADPRREIRIWHT